MGYLVTPVLAGSKGSSSGLSLMAWRDGGREVYHLLLGVLKALGHVVEGLVGGDGVLGHACLGWVEGQQFGLVAHGVLQLTERREQTRAVRLDGPLLATHAELHREPVARGQLLDVVVGSPEGGESDLLGELREIGVREERRVT